MRDQKATRKWGVPLILVALMIAIFALNFSFAPDAVEGEESFAGTDSVVTGVLEDQGVEPWFTPVFEPGSGEIESGLFALQAALGAGLLGFALGNLQGRAKGRREQTEASQPSPSEPATSD